MESEFESDKAYMRFATKEDRFTIDSYGKRYLKRVGRPILCAATIYYNINLITQPNCPITNNPQLFAFKHFLAMIPSRDSKSGFPIYAFIFKICLTNLCLILISF